MITWWSVSTNAEMGGNAALGGRIMVSGGQTDTRTLGAPPFHTVLQLQYEILE
jgi:hypothetical protein